MVPFFLFSPQLQGLYGLQVRYNQLEPSTADIFDSTQLLLLSEEVVVLPELLWFMFVDHIII